MLLQCQKNLQIEESYATAREYLSDDDIYDGFVQTADSDTELNDNLSRNNLLGHYSRAIQIQRIPVLLRI